MYYYKKKNTILIDKPYYYLDIKNSGLNENEIANKFKERANQMYCEFINNKTISPVLLFNQ